MGINSSTICTKKIWEIMKMGNDKHGMKKHIYGETQRKKQKKASKEATRILKRGENWKTMAGTGNQTQTSSELTRCPT
jgi:hypothetical protein